MIESGNVRVSLERREAFLDGRPVALGGRAFEVLAALIRANGQVVGKEQLLREVWAGTVVEDNNLQVQVSSLRKAFGDRGFIQTVARRGYRLAGAVSLEPPGHGLAVESEAKVEVTIKVRDRELVTTLQARVLLELLAHCQVE
ncbi:hypothetical protein E2H86_05065 [Pseudomonas putida]|uniref:winged helix-turn-helix domain-containing protein n=1 Tax=Pseudomonas sp. HD6421 TaxID=2860319 RepID=UPI00105A1387|nr:MULTISPECIES: winged helix-turn-helix domain-containing protein [Pseudomonas]MBF8744017.1 winged helix-turn-helix domain-containing protein [Pseudomonas monteilii]MCT8164244.1 winged helix-turn-helix domain-containing protein [Pseudomonas sp. HD6422]MCT8181900.1 winged helix-turn-helix domain-containing protein [Pseudomonas sp. HD6421]TDJ78135.1 hypothetical protein E2H86_05065 [Pseudomonas putida]